MELYNENRFFQIKLGKKIRPDADGILPEVFLFTFHRNYRNSLRKRCGVIS